MTRKEPIRKSPEEDPLLVTEAWERTFDAVPDLISIIDTHHKILRVNRAMADKLGVSPEQAIGMTCYEHVHETSCAPGFCPHSKLLADQREHTAEIYEKRLGGYFLVSCTPLRDHAGKLIGSVHVARDITRRREAEDALKASRDQLHLILDSAAEAIYGLDLQGNCTFCNSACLRLLGYGKQEDLIGKNMHNLIHHRRPDGTPFPLEECRIFQAFQSGKGTHVDDEVLWRADGTAFPAEYWSYPQHRDGKVVGAVVTFVDISERRKAEDALRRSEERFRQMFEEHAAVMMILDPDTGAIIAANHAASRFYGYSREQLTGMNITEINQLSREAVIGAYSKAVSQAQNDFIFPHRLADGSLRTVEVHSTPITIDEKTFLFSIIHDITERKRAEELLAHRTALLTSLLDSIPDIVFFKDINGVYLGCNPRFAAFVGRPRDQIAGRTDHDLFPKDTADFFRENDRIMMEQGTPRHNEEWVDFPDGHRELLDTFKAPLHTLDGTVIGLLGISRDITERKRNEQAIFEANKKLNMLNSITRHDVLNQITALGMLLQVVLETSTDPQVLDFVRKSQDTTERITRQIEFTKEYQDIGVLSPVWQDVPGLIAASRDLFAGLPFEVRVETGPLGIFADPLLNKVFYNLLENAVRHGEKVTRVRFHARETEAGLVLVYEDDGAGIDAESKKHLFRQGFGKHTGFGLYLMKEILAITGITIAETGEPGKGARFEIAIPKGNYRLGEPAKPA